MTRPRQFHHISLMVLCVILTALLRTDYSASDWQWWVILLLNGYVIHPLFDSMIDSLQARRAERQAEDWYRLVEP